MSQGLEDHSSVISIPELTSDAAVNLALDTISKEKQALIFVSTKASAEALAERIGKHLKPFLRAKQLSLKALNVLQPATKQCKRLAACLEKGIAFHHSGLAAKQRELIENGFRQGVVKIITCTPTLAYGLNLPAFRVVIRDLKRFSGYGYRYIPVLEYHQFTGRAGRPGLESFGEAISIASSQAEKEFILEHYILGVPEEITSKLGVAPVFRTYILSLVALDYAKSFQDLASFMLQTFYAKHFGDEEGVKNLILKALKQLMDWGFIIEEEGFLKATIIGTRVSELYIDPLTAHIFLKALSKASVVKPSNIGFLHLICSSIEMQPLLSVKVKDYEWLVSELENYRQELLIPEPSEFDPEHETFLQSFKTSLMFNAWINEVSENQILEDFKVRPGELHAKLEIADWLCYALSELSRLKGLKRLQTPLAKLRLQLKYGVKQELLPLVALKDIGRVRARKLFNAGIKTVKDLKTVSLEQLQRVLGPSIGLKVKQQVSRQV
ncbi:hypothetical protein J7L02_03150 [Candidatus Woesearchaeota archaeon]|nr:hypothetical protein [Candidatus Woesearchaeota archaeon]